MAAQLRAMKRPVRLEAAWTRRATASLPVPVSPWMSTVTGWGATLSARSRAAMRAGWRPMMAARMVLAVLVGMRPSSVLGRWRGHAGRGEDTW